MLHSKLTKISVDRYVKTTISKAKEDSHNKRQVNVTFNDRRVLSPTGLKKLGKEKINDSYKVVRR